MSLCFKTKTTQQQLRSNNRGQLSPFSPSVKVGRGIGEVYESFYCVRARTSDWCTFDRGLSGGLCDPISLRFNYFQIWAPNAIWNLTESGTSPATHNALANQISLQSCNVWPTYWGLNQCFRSVTNLSSWKHYVDVKLAACLAWHGPGRHRQCKCVDIYEQV